MAYQFNFPANKRAKPLTIAEQCSKVAEEVMEVKVAEEYGEGALRVCEEAFDVIVAAESLIRKFEPNVRDDAYRLVMSKNESRGDWRVGIA